jgi:predicted metalloprotease with PDZ domain
VTRADFAEDLERTLAPTEIASRKDYQRGALYAAALDAAVQKASRGARSLDDLMRALKDQAAGRGALPVRALAELITKELGAGRGEELDWVMVRGHGEITLPDDAFGPCFRRERTKTKEYELGFDAAGLRQAPAIIRGLVPGSAAARAGLSEGAIVVSEKIPSAQAFDPEKHVELVVADGRGGRKVRYVPVRERQRVRWIDKPGCR